MASDEPNGRVHVRRLDDHYTLPSFRSLEEWLARREDLRRRILVSAGLWPWPQRHPLVPRVTGGVEREGYSIENLYFESRPGLLVCGNLYRPTGREGPFPGVLCPHGHWSHGRFEHSDVCSIPTRCANLALQGYVVFAYDMVGYNDSGVQLPHASASSERTGFWDDQAGYLWGISLLGLQLWNSIRALDMLAALPDVDARRLACTGASGGGTQTFLLAAVDERVRVAAPVNMISSRMQGGCLCENAPGLRLDCTNVEFGAMTAPRPLLLVSATGDWTSDTPQREFPAIQSIYRLYGAEDRVASVQVDAPHNYNQASREAVYAWFGRWLLGSHGAEQLRERPILPAPTTSMLVFPDRRLPPQAATRDQVPMLLKAEAREQLSALRPHNAASLEAYRLLFGPAYRLALSVREPLAAETTASVDEASQLGAWRMQRLALGRTASGERIPGLFFGTSPAPTSGLSKAALVVHPAGKDALVKDGQPLPVVRELLARGFAVLGIDCFGTGESAALAAERDKSLPHFLCYNRSDACLRIQDILTASAYLRSLVESVSLVGLEQAGLWCLLAAGVSQGLAGVVADTARFDCEDDQAWVRDIYIPHLRRAGDVRTAAALAAPVPIALHNLSCTFPSDCLRTIYLAAGFPEALHLQGETMRPDEIAAWLAR